MSGSSDMFGNDPMTDDYGYGSVDSLVGASVGVNSGWAYDTPKTTDTATTNAIQSMAPVQSGSGGANDYSRFWQGLIGSVVNTGVAVVASKNGLVQPGTTTPVVTPPPNPNRGLLLVALGVGVVLFATRKG